MTIDNAVRVVLWLVCKERDGQSRLLMIQIHLFCWRVEPTIPKPVHYLKQWKISKQLHRLPFCDWTRQQLTVLHLARFVIEQNQRHASVASMILYITCSLWYRFKCFPPIKKQFDCNITKIRGLLGVNISFNSLIMSCKFVIREMNDLAIKVGFSRTLLYFRRTTEKIILLWRLKAFKKTYNSRK